MKQNKSILHLCEVILGVLMLILILNLYLVKLLVDPDISYTPMYRNLCLTLALLVFCMVLALIQRELLARLLHNAYRDVTGIHNKKSLEKKLLELNDRATTFFLYIYVFSSVISHANLHIINIFFICFYSCFFNSEPFFIQTYFLILKAKK